MAGLVRFRSMQLMVNRLIQRRSVGTSNAKKSDTITAPSATSSTTSDAVASAQSLCKPKKKTWVSYGFSEVDEEVDKKLMHISMFVAITIVFTFGGWVFCYLPDFRLHDWAKREAYLELRRREELGLPRIDVNYIDPAKVKLPTDEELGDTEIII